MSNYGKLPADYPIDAMALEVDRRRKQLDRPYSYGQLIADTTQGEREQLAEEYKSGFRRRRRGGGTRSTFLETKGEAVAEVRRKNEEEDSQDGCPGEMRAVTDRPYGPE